MTLTKYASALRKHDWSHMYSDDPEIRRRGGDQKQLLQDIAAESLEHQELYDTTKAAFFDKEGWEGWE